MDIRLLNDKNAGLLNQMKIKRIHFAWDFPDDDLLPLFKKWRPLLKGGRSKYMVYVLVNFNSTLLQDLRRIYRLRDLGYDPYVMIYNKPNAPLNIKRLARYVNNYFIFRSPKVKNFKGYMMNIKSYRDSLK